MDTWRTRPRKSCDSCDKELADEKDDAEWNRLDCPDDWRDDLCWKYFGGECQEPDWRKLKSDLAAIRARCEVAEKERDALKADLAAEVADNVALRATHVTQGTADHVASLEAERDALMESDHANSMRAEAAEADDKMHQEVLGEKINDLIDRLKEHEEVEYYCGCEHHRPGATAQALWDEDGCCQVCGVDVDPWTQNALVAEAKLARVREWARNAVLLETEARELTAIIDQEPI
jgi:hypothetical protein